MRNFKNTTIIDSFSLKGRLNTNGKDTFLSCAFQTNTILGIFLALIAANECLALFIRFLEKSVPFLPILGRCCCCRRWVEFFVSRCEMKLYYTLPVSFSQPYMHVHAVLSLCFWPHILMRRDLKCIIIVGNTLSLPPVRFSVVSVLNLSYTVRRA